MKLFLGEANEDSTDDEFEEEASEEDQEGEESSEDGGGGGGGGGTAQSSDEKDNDPEEDYDTDSESAVLKNGQVKIEGKSFGESKNVINKANGKPSKNVESENESDGSLSSDTDHSRIRANGKLESNGVNREISEAIQRINSGGSNPLSGIKSADTISAPTGFKSVTTEIMVLEAIKTLNERGGSSAIAIKKYIMNNYAHGPRTMMLIKKFIKKALADGKLVQAKGNGLGGSFKISAEAIRLEEKKKREKRKKLVKKIKKDEVGGKEDKKAKPSSTKAKAKESKNGKKATVTAKKPEQTKVTKNKTKISGVVVVAATQKGPKVSAALKKLPEVTDSKQQTKKTNVKDAVKSADMHQVPKQTKGTKATSSAMKTAAKKASSPVKSASAPEVATAKAKTATTMAKKKPAAAKGKAMTTTKTGAADANAMKPTKKTAKKKTKGK